MVNLEGENEIQGSVNNGSVKETSDSHKRLFLALRVNEACQNAIAKWQATHFASYDLPWVLPQNYHITLVFLGSYPEKYCSLLIEQLKNFRCGRLFERRFALEYWPKQSLICLRLTEPSVELIRLQCDLLSQVKLLLGKEFVHSPRNFIPHITLARPVKYEALLSFPAIKNTENASLVGEFSSMENPIVSFNSTIDFDRFDIFESLSINAEVHYRSLASWHIV